MNDNDTPAYKQDNPVDNKTVIERQAFSDALHNVGQFVAPKADGRPILRSVNFRILKSDAALGRRLEMVATNSYTLIRQFVPLTEWGQDFEITLDWDSLQRALKLFTEGELLTMFEENGEVTIADGSATFTPKVMAEGDFPNWESLMLPTEAPQGIGAFNPKFLALFNKLKGGDVKLCPVKFTQVDALKPMHFAIGDNITGLLMPIRVD